MSNHPIPVLIVGAGPSGLSMAVELQRHKIPFRIIDKCRKPVGTSNALVAQTRTLEVWDDNGLLHRALREGMQILGLNLYDKNKKVSSVKFDQLESIYKFVLAISQHQTESILQESLQKNNIAIEMEVELLDISEQEENILATLRHLNGKIETVKTDWLIASDGAHSVIRDKLHLPFQGKELKQHFVLADMIVGPHFVGNKVNLFLSSHGILALLAFNHEEMRIIADVSHDAELCQASSMTKGQIDRILAERCPFSLPIKQIKWTSGFWIHERIISSYSHGRVFFVGDSAHIHSPVGGQGMNTGIQDAYNLAWKLALVIKKFASSSILTSYQTERYDIAKAVLKNTTKLTRLMTLKNPVAILLRNWFLKTSLKFPIVQKKLTMTLTELEIKYKNSLLIKECLKDKTVPSAGMRMLDIVLEDGRLLDKGRGTDFCLLLFAGLKNPCSAKEISELQAVIAQKFPVGIKCVVITTQEIEDIQQENAIILDKKFLIHRRYQVIRPRLYLIRPDKYIGFRGEMRHQKELLDYLGGFLI